VFSSSATYVADNPDTQNVDHSGALYLGDGDTSITWLTRPQTPNPIPAPGDIQTASSFQAAGASPDLSTLYFAGGPTLLPSDVARPGHSTGLGNGDAWGLYEYSGGTLKPAGTLPDGTEDPGGAAPATSVNSQRNVYNLNTPETFGNQVSRDGSTLFFVSPDPGFIPALGPVTELYVRRGGHSTLVSHAADMSPAPSGAQPVLTRNGPARAQPYPHQYAFGSADGTSAVFQSTDALTAEAPNDGSLKSYRYIVATDTVTYLPGVDGATVLAASDDGSRFLFGDLSRVALWDNGTIKTVASQNNDGSNIEYQLTPARATASGSVFTFSTPAPIIGFNSGGFVQIYRYDVSTGDLTCLSCPPVGIVPSGDAVMVQQSTGVLAARGMTDDARRVFFQSPDALVRQDSNGQSDVYEWTSSGRSLISSGRSHDPAFILDNSANGDDVFFATTEGLAPEDRDGSYDVYDARVGGGFKLADQAAPCEGDGCQGEVSTPSSLTTPDSNGVSASGNQLSADDGAGVVRARLKLGGRIVMGGVLHVTVTISGPGRVTVSGSGWPTVKRRYAKAGTYKITAKLSTAIKRTLKHRHRVSLSARVGFTPSSGRPVSASFVITAKA
jgi:hypothetical protein